MPVNETMNNEDSVHFVMPSDVKKYGYMKKLKGNKRKYFVLRLNDANDYNSATLSYYDNEKKFRANSSVGGQNAKRTTHLNDCFAIQAKLDPKHRHVLAFYTKEDCLCTVLGLKAELDQWLDAIQDIFRLSTEYQKRKLRDFEHIWQVNINKTGLGLTRNINGVHRICLLNNILYLVRVDPTADYENIFEFPLSTIRRCGHTTSTFFIELGRSSLIGPGDLWIQTENQMIAQNMHEVILDAMSAGSAASTLEEAEEMSHRTFNNRPRSSSTSTEKSNTSTNNGRSRMHNSFKHSSCFEHGTNPSTHIHYDNPCYNHCHGQSPTTSRERLHSGSWSRTTSECSNDDFSQLSSSNSSSATATPVGPCCCDFNVAHHWSSSSCCNHSLEFNNGKSSSNQSIDCDSDHSIGDGGVHQCTASMIPVEPPISEEDFFPTTSSSAHHAMHLKTHHGPQSHSSLHHHHHHFMSSQHCYQFPHLSHNSFHSTGRHFRSPPNYCNKCSSCFYSGHFNHYLPTVPAGNSSDYLPMNPVGNELNNNEPKNVSDEEDRYLDMAPLSPTSKSTSTSGGNISSNNQVNVHSNSMSFHSDSSSIELHLEKVRSYYGNDDGVNGKDKNAQPLPNTCTFQQNYSDDSIFNGLTRAYSTGSRPQPLGPTLAAQCIATSSTVPPITSTNTLNSSLNSNENSVVSNSNKTPTNSASTTLGNNSKNSSANRIRAFSTGSHGLNLAAIRLDSKRKKLLYQLQQQKQSQQPNTLSQLVGSSLENDTTICSTSTSSLAEEELTKKNHKASSAPVLSPFIQQRTRSATLGSKPSTYIPGTIHHQHHHKGISHTHHHLRCHISSNEVVCANGCIMLYEQQQSQLQPPQQLPQQPEAESDLMEIDYSGNPKNNRPRPMIDETGNIVSGFEEELLREAKKKESLNERNRIDNGTKVQSSLTTVVNTPTTTTGEHRKRSDSTSTIGSLFGPSKPNRAVGNHHLMDNLVATFKQSLQMQSNTSGSDTQSDYIVMGSNSQTKPPTSETSKNSSKNEQKNKNSFGISGRVRKAPNQTSNKTDLKKYNEEEEYSLMAPISVHNNVDTSNHSSEMRSKSQYQEGNNDDEGSTYVMMAPNNPSQKFTNTTGKKQKSVFSLISSLTPSTGNNSSNRKNSFSDRLRFNIASNKDSDSKDNRQKSNLSTKSDSSTSTEDKLSSTGKISVNHTDQEKGVGNNNSTSSSVVTTVP